MLSNGGESKWNAQFRAVTEGDTEIRRDENLECLEKWLELHLEALGTPKTLNREVTSLERVGWNINMARSLPVTNLAGPAVFSGEENKWGVRDPCKMGMPMRELLNAF